MELQLRAAGIKYQREYKAIEGRRFRWDFAIEHLKILLEVQGGIWVKGGHSSGSGIERDTEKLNLATVRGWSVLQVVRKQIEDGRALGWVQELIKLKGGS